MATPYIPNRDADFDTWLLNFSTLLTAAPLTYGLTAPDAVVVAGRYAAWHPAYLAAIDPGTRTAATVAAKDAARIDAEVIVRPFAVSISINPSVDDEDKVAIGVTVRATVPTPVPPPGTAPILGIQSAIPLQQTLTYKEPGADGKYKPAGVIGCEIFRAIGAVAAVDPAQASYVATATKTPFRMPFVSGDQGKVCTYFARWVTRSGPAGIAQSGPWSAPLVVTVM